MIWLKLMWFACSELLNEPNVALRRSVETVCLLLNCPEALGVHFEASVATGSKWVSCRGYLIMASKSSQESAPPPLDDGVCMFFFDLIFDHGLGDGKPSSGQDILLTETLGFGFSWRCKLSYVLFGPVFNILFTGCAACFSSDILDLWPFFEALFWV